MRFTKMHGIGNDYVYVDCTRKKLAHPEEIARVVSHRGKGIGSDGLILICPSKTADFRMEMYNADGSVGKMCGNGIRCVAKYVYDRGMTDKTRLRVETLSGVKTLELMVQDGLVEQIQVNMGIPLLKPEEVPVLGRGEQLVGEPILVGKHTYAMTCVSMGNPHAVVFLDHVESLELEKLGPLFENHERFPQRVNTEFAQVLDGENIRMRVWERGSGETLACGTGACAVLVAAVLNGYTQRQALVHLLGGELTIRWSREDGCVYMTGPAAFVFDGDIDLGDLE